MAGEAAPQPVTSGEGPKKETRPRISLVETSNEKNKEAAAAVLEKVGEQLPDLEGKPMQREALRRSGYEYVTHGRSLRSHRRGPHEERAQALIFAGEAKIKTLEDGTEVLVTTDGKPLYELVSLNRFGVAAGAYVTDLISGESAQQVNDLYDSLISEAASTHSETLRKGHLKPEELVKARLTIMPAEELEGQVIKDLLREELLDLMNALDSLPDFLGGLEDFLPSDFQGKDFYEKLVITKQYRERIKELVKEQDYSAIRILVEDKIEAIDKLLWKNKKGIDDVKHYRGWASRLFGKERDEWLESLEKDGATYVDTHDKLTILKEALSRLPGGNKEREDLFEEAFKQAA